MQEKRQKPTVQYVPFRDFKIVVGDRAQVIPLDHPDTYHIDNGRWASTSPVQSYDEATGNFETLNTFYVLATQLKL